MPSVVIRIDPARLTDPDADLRYELPDMLSERSGGLVESEGYDYEPEGVMQIYLDTADADLAVRHVITLLENEHLRGNHLARAAQIGVSEAYTAEACEFQIVYPRGVEGVIHVPPKVQ
jgi:hypothetical protein